MLHNDSLHHGSVTESARTVVRVPVKEHIANYRAARALLGTAKKGAWKSAVKKANTKE